jgi:hypothetical protein
MYVALAKYAKRTRLLYVACVIATVLAGAARDELTQNTTRIVITRGEGMVTIS